jgi:putative transposase
MIHRNNQKKEELSMSRVAKRIKKNKEVLWSLRLGKDWDERLADVLMVGKAALDETCGEVGRILVETLMMIERENISGADYQPINEEMHKWGFQGGSVYIGKQKVKVSHPRLRHQGRELPLGIYERLKKPENFSEAMLANALRGLSGRKYKQTVEGLAGGFGISASSISRRVIEASSAKLKEFQERDLNDFKAFAIFLDTIHRGGSAFTVALGIDTKGRKQALGLWEGATENAEIAKSLLSEMEARGLKLHKEIIFVTDGGGGIIRALKDRFGKHLLHQRCTVHKDRNIQRHLPKKYRREAHLRFRTAMNLKTYEEAQQALENLRAWLKGINESSARSLQEAQEELLTLHRLKVPELLRKTLHSTNSIESTFSTVRHCEKNIKRYRSSRMSQRWLASVLLYAESNFRTVNGHNEIPWVIQRIRMEQKANESGNQQSESTPEALSAGV